MWVDSKLIRGWYIGWKIKELIENSDLTITELSNKIWSSRPTVNNVLNWRTSWTDNFYTKIMKWIWLSDKDIIKIFKEADREEFLYKYDEDISNDKEMSYDDIWTLLKEKENLNDAQIKAVEEFIAFQKSKGN